MDFIVTHFNICLQADGYTLTPLDPVTSRIVALKDTAGAHYKNNNEQKALHYHNQALQLAKKIWAP